MLSAVLSAIVVVLVDGSSPGMDCTSDEVLPPGGDMHKCKALIMLINEESRGKD